jgi:succinate dehydrogenase / fumarate reductase cytochrome b subunit
MLSSDGRPIYLDLAKIKLPMPGFISIIHRVTGVLLSLSIPFFTYLFGLSLSGEKGFIEASDIIQSPLLIPLLLVLMWGFVHHLFAGIRYLLIDFEIGVERDISNKSSYVVLVAAIVVALIIAWGIWL